MLGSATAAGTAGVTFAGQIASLYLSSAGLSAPIIGMRPSDIIRVDGVASQNQSVVHVDASGHATVGTVTLDLPDLANTDLIAINDAAHTGTFLTQRTSVALANDTGTSADDVTSDPTLHGVSVPNAAVFVSVDDGAVTGGVQADPRQLDVQPGLTDGTHTAVAQTFIDLPSGPAVFDVAQLTITVDMTPPSAPTIDQITPARGRQRFQHWRHYALRTADPDTLVSIVEGNTVLGQVTSDDGGEWSLQLPTPLGNGDHTLMALASDAAANAILSDPADITINAPPPQPTQVPLLDPPG